MRRYFTTFYCVEFACDDVGERFDYLHPEWANLRIVDTSELWAENRAGTRIGRTGFFFTGPSSHAVRFEFDGPFRMWGIGVLPLGWAKFFRADAALWADVLVDGHGDDRLAEFSDLARRLFHGAADREAELERINAFFLERQHLPVTDEARILAIHTALIDPEIDNVSALVERAGVSQRTLERVCQRAFGFSPKLLLRRQRFLRSLAKYVLDPSLRWIGALDSQYHDQAQFVRDFKQFMGMSPRQYGLLDKPILTAVMRERARFAGKAVQGLDTPAGGGN
ncbi:MAG: helix-turn-helix domain-containing protein [Novosphingobium sp.]